MTQPYPTPAPVVALDIGNVCLQLRHDDCARTIGYPDMATLLAAHPELLDQARRIEIGQAGETAFFAALRQIFGNPAASEDHIRQVWCSILGPEMPGMAAFVREVVDLGLRPVFFSDVSPLHYKALLPMLSFASLIDGAVLSYEVGCQKPEAGMYEAMERRYCGGNHPLLYIDDKRGNVEAARRRGWHAYRFGTAEGARKALADHLAACRT